MPHRTAFDESVGCYFIEWSGTVEADEWQAWFREIANYPRFRKGLNGLHDLRQAAFRLDQQELLRVADILRMTEPMYGAGRVANVVPDEKSRALMQSFLSIARSLERSRKIFTSYEDAKAWLGLPVDYVAPFEVSEDSAEQR